MPPISDLNVVRSLLNRDRQWAAYAIGDLSPGLVEHCEWRAPVSGAPALLLVYRGFSPPITFAMGDARELCDLFAEIHEPEISLHVRPEAIDAISPIYRPMYTRVMKRMALQPEAYRAVPHDDAREINAQHLAAVAALYDDGHRRNEGPTFFHSAMLEQKTFRGIWEDDALVAIAGTHLFSAEEGVCAIGNVYTRSDRRGRGLAARVTSAVVVHALNEHVTTIVLNVGESNVAAQRVYERLGFEHYCEFMEGEARRTSEL